MFLGKIKFRLSYNLLRTKRSYTHSLYGRLPKMWAALLTSHVKFRDSTYRTKHWLRKASQKSSPRKYHGMNVGRKKQNRIFIRTKCLFRGSSKNEGVGLEFTVFCSGFDKIHSNFERYH